MPGTALNAVSGLFHLILTTIQEVGTIRDEKAEVCESCWRHRRARDSPGLEASFGALKSALFNYNIALPPYDDIEIFNK